MPAIVLKVYETTFADPDDMFSQSNFLNHLAGLVGCNYKLAVIENKRQYLSCENSRY